MGAWEQLGQDVHLNGQRCTVSRIHLIPIHHCTVERGLLLDAHVRLNKIPPSPPVSCSKVVGGRDRARLYGVQHLTWERRLRPSGSETYVICPVSSKDLDADAK
ncbi:hypothetical protein C8035_v004003 [Colletotrichum spinosum]|uniref:Uncharacterized protein n=1 Tax=Colletotrichum spinosum TaxID=1347390 RepID=A0A4R8PZE5_9PEZI|nr:hypothetical protein C8035_v004003 [Colletotrichum spinosum]